MGVIITEEPENIVIVTPEEESHVIRSAIPVSRVIAAVGGGSTQNFYREGVNYDGGRAGEKYGDLPPLNGGGAADGRRYPV